MEVVVSFKMKAFWDITAYSLVIVDRRFRGACCLHHQPIIALMMEIVRTSETSVYYNETTRNDVPEGSALRTCNLT
jgi:hypothetical protein